MKLGIMLMLCLLLASCATGTGGLNSAVKTTQLRPGMTSTEVTSLLGQPGSSQFVSGYVVWKYKLQKPWVGWIPYYLAFEPKGMTLVSWQENMQEYYASQSLWIQALPKQHNVNVSGSVNQNITGTIDHNVRFK